MALSSDLRYDAPVDGPPPDAESLRKALKPLWNSGEFRLIVVFGSIAKGTGGPSSDLDLGVLPRETMDEIGVTAEVVRLTHCNDVDVVDLTRADPLTAMEVARAGQVLFCEDPSVFTEFRSLAFRRYVDTEKLRKAQRRALDLFEKRVMSPVERSLIERKLGEIAERLSHLDRYVREGWDPYRTSLERRKAAEKLLQEVIEAAIDVNTHVLVELGRSVPRDYHHSFTELGRRGWLPEDLAQRLAPAAGLRNRLVHRYSAIDDRKVFDALTLALELFPAYIGSIRRLIEAGT